MTESSFLLKSSGCLSLCCGLWPALPLQSTAGVCDAVLCYLAHPVFACYLTDYSLQLLSSEIIDSFMGSFTFTIASFLSFSAFSDLWEFSSWLDDRVLPECIWLRLNSYLAGCGSSVYWMEVKEEKLWKSL